MFRKILTNGHFWSLVKIVTFSGEGVAHFLKKKLLSTQALLNFGERKRLCTFMQIDAQSFTP